MTIEAEAPSGAPAPLPERPPLERIVAAAIRFRWAVLAAVLLLCALGVWSFQRLPIDATPDITNVLAQEVRMPGETLFARIGARHRGLRRKLRDVPDALIYQR